MRVVVDLIKRSGEHAGAVFARSRLTEDSALRNLRISDRNE